MYGKIISQCCRRFILTGRRSTKAISCFLNFTCNHVLTLHDCWLNCVEQTTKHANLARSCRRCSEICVRRSRWAWRWCWTWWSTLERASSAPFRSRQAPATSLRSTSASTGNTPAPSSPETCSYITDHTMIDPQKPFDK